MHKLFASELYPHVNETACPACTTFLWLVLLRRQGAARAGLHYLHYQLSSEPNRSRQRLTSMATEKRQGIC